MRILAAVAASCLAIACGSPPAQEAPPAASAPQPAPQPAPHPAPHPARAPPAPAVREDLRARAAAARAEGEAQVAAKGLWTPPDPARWTASTEGYTSFLWGRRLLPLGPRAVAFARYLNDVHNHVHPIFGTWIIASLDHRPKDDPLNDPRLVTRLEIVFDGEGRIVRLGVSRTSGNAEFDLAALDAFDRARPFALPPPEVLSSDGYLYVAWEMHRDEVYACSTMNARPYLLDAVR